MRITVTPAYGRDYSSQKAAREAWQSGKDFIIADIQNPWSGKPINLQDARSAGIETVNVRYAKLRKVLPITVK